MRTDAYLTSQKAYCSLIINSTWLILYKMMMMIIIIIIIIIIEVNFNLEQATKAQRGSRGIALLLL